MFSNFSQLTLNAFKKRLYGRSGNSPVATSPWLRHNHCTGRSLCSDEICFFLRLTVFPLRLTVPLTELDRKLLSELLAGKTGSWKVFVDRFTGLIVQIIQQTAHAHSLRLQQDDIEDLCAETYAELLSRDMAALRAFRGRCSFATYLAVIVRRIVVRRLTEQRFRQALGHVSAHSKSVEMASSENSDTTQVDQRDEVQSLMQRLPERSRELLRLVFIEGRPYREVAGLLGVSINSLGALIARVRSAALQNSSR